MTEYKVIQSICRCGAVIPGGTHKKGCPAIALEFKIKNGQLVFSSVQPERASEREHGEKNSAKSC